MGKADDQVQVAAGTASGAGDWAGRALAAVLERVARTADEVGARFPLHADPETGAWTTTGRGSWTGGCWAGLLWLRALSSGAPEDRAAAARCTERLGYWTAQDTAARGLVLWYGTALAAGPGSDEAAAALRDRAARACLAAYEPERGVVPWGGAFGGPRLLARADGVPGLVPLLAGAPGGGRAAAYGHLTRHLALCLAEDPPRPAWQARPDGTWAAYAEPAPGWSRTAGWLLLGVADGLWHLRESELWEAAGRLVALRTAPGAALVPPAQDGPGGAGQPPGPPDTSAAAIEAVAALKLAALARAAGRGSEGDRLTRWGQRILHRLSVAHLSPSGALRDGCYDAARGLASRHELVWGDFFFAWGLALRTGLVEPFTM